MTLRFWLISSLVLGSIRADTILEDKTHGDVRIKSLAVSGSSFNEKRLEQIARKELSTLPRAKIIRLLMFGDRSGAPLPKADHMSYYDWRKVYEVISKTPTDIAEMLSIEDNAVLRVSRKNGTLKRTVLKGHDPLQIDIEGQNYEIAHLDLNVLPTVNIYLRTTAPLGVGPGRQLFRQLSALFGGFNILIAARNDAWFIFEPNYPFVNPFQPKTSVPTFEEYSGSPTLRCGLWSGSTQCELK